MITEEIETVLRGLPGFRDAGVVGLPDERLGEEIAAFIDTDGGPLGGLRALLMAHFQPDRRPRIVRIVEALPYNRNEKSVRRDLE